MEEIKQKLELGFNPKYAGATNDLLDLISQALQKRDEAIIGAIRTTFPSFDDNPNWGENEKTILKTTDYVVKGVIDLINAK